MKKEFKESVFNNKNRSRYYGIRVGDTVKLKFYPGTPLAEVIAYGAGDNNRVKVKLERGSEIDHVAEWCEVVEKIEDKMVKAAAHDLLQALLDIVNDSDIWNDVKAVLFAEQTESIEKAIKKATDG